MKQRKTTTRNASGEDKQGEAQNIEKTPRAEETEVREKKKSEVCPRKRKHRVSGTGIQTQGYRKTPDQDRQKQSQNDYLGEGGREPRAKNRLRKKKKKKKKKKEKKRKKKKREKVSIRKRKEGDKALRKPQKRWHPKDENTNGCRKLGYLGEDGGQITARVKNREPENQKQTNVKRKEKCVRSWGRHE